MTTTKSIPEWLKQHLTDIGRLNTDGVSRRAKLRRCPRCNAPTVTGLDHQPCGVPVHLDPVPLTPAAELVAHRLGRRTFDLTRTPTIDPRNPWNLTHREHLVLPHHYCRDGVPLRIDNTVLRLFVPTPPADTEEAPF